MGQAIMTMRFNKEKIESEGKYDIDKIKSTLDKRLSEGGVKQIEPEIYEGKIEFLLTEIVEYMDCEAIADNLSELTLKYGNESNPYIEDALALRAEGRI